MQAGPRAIGIDSGATFTRIQDSKQPLRRLRTPHGYYHYLHMLQTTLGDAQPIAALVIALAAIIEKQRVIVAPNLDPDWIGQDLATDLRARLPISGPIYFCQDTEAAGYGVQAQELAGLDPTLLLTLSSGVGGAFVSQNYVRPLEVGHMILNLSGSSRRCACGQSGCVEADLSGTGIANNLGLQTETLEDPHFWRAYGAQLGKCLLVLTPLFKLRQIILVGGLCQRAPLFLPEAERVLIEGLIYVPQPLIRLARQGDTLGAQGAYLLASRALLSS